MMLGGEGRLAGWMDGWIGWLHVLANDMFWGDMKGVEESISFKTHMMGSWI